jgi:hypothetical protein
LEIRTRNLIIWAGVFVAAFLISLIIFLARPGRTDQFVLFFPSETTDEWIGEARNIHHTREIEKSIQALLQELALGPITLRLEPALPKGTGVRSVLLRERTVYLNFTAHLAVLEAGFQISFDAMLAGVRKSVLYNFPTIDEVVIYVDGASTELY